MGGFDVCVCESLVVDSDKTIKKGEKSMKIRNLICSPGRTGFFFDDQKAIKTGAIADGNTYRGEPKTPGFTKVRQAGESVGIHLVLDDGQIAWGDCAAVQYSGTGGRDPLFLAKDFIPVIERELKPLLIDLEITTFREMSAWVDSRISSQGKPLHTAIRYGITQALLDARAKSRKKLMAEVIAEEYGLEISEKTIPIFTQSGDDRYDNVDKMIIKGADVLPHGLINTLEKIGSDGEHLLQYVAWLRERIELLKPEPSYRPILHLDVYGMLGTIFENDLERIAEYSARLQQQAAPHLLRIEGPLDLGERKAQMEVLRDLRFLLDSRDIRVEIVADEWCNTLEDVRYFTENKSGHIIQIKTPDLGGIHNSIEAVLYCKEKGMGAYLGGTCNETHRSAQICAHIAMSTSPDQCLAKPGMGVDTAFMIAYNEMQSILALKNRG